MQKVEGSSPFSRFVRKPRSWRGFLVSEAGVSRARGPALPRGATKLGLLAAWMARYGALHALGAIWIGQKGPTSVAFLMAVDPYPFDMAPFGSYLRVSRARLGPAGRTHLRAVYVSEIIRTPDHGEALDEWMFKRAPLFYGAPEDIATSFKHTTDFTKPIRDTVVRLPSGRSLPEVAFWRDPRRCLLRAHSRSPLALQQAVPPNGREHQRPYDGPGSLPSARGLGVLLFRRGQVVREAGARRRGAPQRLVIGPVPSRTYVRL